MIDTYFDRCDAASGFRSTARFIDSNDPRYFAGQLYATVIDRNVAEARLRIADQVEVHHWLHSHELRQGIRMGGLRSNFDSNGRRR